MIKSRVKINKIWLCLLLVLCILCTGSLSFSQNIARAESEIEYTSVLEDLEKDEDFNPDSYPANLSLFLKPQPFQR